MFLIIIVILGNVTLAEDQIIFESFKSESDIIYNGNQIFFDKPIVEIEGNTYVPLREAANKLDISVDWDNSSKTIKLLGDTSESDTVLTIAQRLYEVNLNGYVKLLDYSYFLDGIENMYQEYLIAKFKIQKEDIENIEEIFVNSGYKKDDDFQLNFWAEQYEWIDINNSGNFTTYIYRKPAEHAKHVRTFAVTINTDNIDPIMYMMSL